MTKEEFEKRIKEEGVKVKAIDIKPYRYYLPCLMGEEERPMFNEICIRRWSEDGKKITFMLDSHNFLFAKPDELVEVVPIKKGQYSNEFYERVDKRDAHDMDVTLSPKARRSKVF